MKLNLNIDNSALIEECRKGDKEALNLLYTRFAPKMLGVITRYVRNLKDAEDILHDGFIVAFTRLESLRDGKRVEFWLASIMKNLSLKFLENQDLSTFFDELPEVEDTPDIEEIIDYETLEKLICKLPVGYQKVFRLSVLENKSHKEIGKMLGISPGTSSSQLFHAKIMMRKIIVDYRLQASLIMILLFLTIGSSIMFKKDSDNIDSFSQIKTFENDYSETNVSEQVNTSTMDGSEVYSGNAKKIKYAVSRKNISDKAIEPEMEYSATVSMVSSENLDEKINEYVEEIEVKKTDGNDLTVLNGNVVQNENESIAAKYLSSLPKRRDTSIGVGINAGMIASLGSGFSSKYVMAGAPSMGDPNIGDEEKEDSKKGEYTTRTESSYNDYDFISHHNDFPIRVSGSFQKYVTDKFSVEADINYTYLHTTFDTYYSLDNARWHYLGLSLKMNIKSFTTGRFKFYGSGGISFDVPISSRMECSDRSERFQSISHTFESYTAWSISASYGTEFKISDMVGIFAEPTIDYHMNHKYVVPNYWTDNKFSFSLPVGFRFTW